jgi:hypothetical protein
VAVGVAATGCAGELTGVGLIAAFAAGLTFFFDARRDGAFFARFFLTFVVFLRVVALPPRSHRLQPEHSLFARCDFPCVLS